MLMDISVCELNKKSKYKNVWCIGIGKRFNEIVAIYHSEPFLAHIIGLADNNKDIWGKEKILGDHIVPISGLEKISGCDKNTILMITSDHCKELYNDIKKVLNTEDLLCYVYPQYYYKKAKLLLYSMKYLPMRRSMVFYAGKEPHDNADEVVSYLMDEYKGKAYKLYYIDETGDDRDKRIKHINKWSLKKKSNLVEVLKYCFVMGTAKFVFYENEVINKVRSDQKLIFMNHGTIPLKNVSDVLKQPLDIDYAICPSKGCSMIYETQYGIKKEKQIYFMPPRVNKLLTCNARLHELIGEDDVQTILWLPTFRQLIASNRKDSLQENAIELLSENKEKINQILKDNDQFLIVKKHPREKKNIDDLGDYTRIKIIDDYYMRINRVSLQEILKGADALLTDYSGIAFEYMLLDRPIGYVITDIEQYHRGFVCENPQLFMPGMKIKNLEDLVAFFKNVKERKDDYLESRKQIVGLLFRENAYKNGTKMLIDFLDSM